MKSLKPTFFLVALLAGPAGGVLAHESGHLEGIASQASKAVNASFDIVHTRISTEGNLAIFHMAVSGKAGASRPSKSGKLAGSSVFSYVWPTSLDSSVAGFEQKAGILAFAELIQWVLIHWKWLTLGTDGVPVPSAVTAAVPAGEAAAGAIPSQQVPAPVSAVKTEVRTDVLAAEVSSQGGDIVRLELLKHRATGDKEKNFVLFDSGEHHVYHGQNGLIGSGLPNHKTLWQLQPGSHGLKDGEDAVRVALEAPIEGGGKVVKTYTFRRGSYLIDIDYQLLNQGAAPLQTSAYFQITRDGKPAESASPSVMGMGAVTFTGPAIYTDKEKFQKIAFADIADESAKYARRATDGWLEMVQHYFVSAWLPK